MRLGTQPDESGHVEGLRAETVSQPEARTFLAILITGCVEVVPVVSNQSQSSFNRQPADPTTAATISASLSGACCRDSSSCAVSTLTNPNGRARPVTIVTTSERDSALPIRSTNPSLNSISASTPAISSHRMKVRADTGTRLRPLLTNSSPASASDTGAASMSSRCASSIVGSQTGASSIRSSARLQSCRMRSRVTPAIFPSNVECRRPFAAEARSEQGLQACSSH